MVVSQWYQETNFIVLSARRGEIESPPRPRAARPPSEESCVFSEHCSERSRKEEGRRAVKIS